MPFSYQQLSDSLVWLQVSCFFFISSSYQICYDELFLLSLLFFLSFLFLINPQLVCATHIYSCYYFMPKSLSHISICIHINVKAAEPLATPMNSHYQSIWTGLSTAGTGLKSYFIPSTSANSVHTDIICYGGVSSCVFQQVISDSAASLAK